MAAGTWIKMMVGLPSKPAVIRMAAILGVEEDLIVGKLLRVWGWADDVTIDGAVPGVTFAWIDRMVGLAGFADAMQTVQWLALDGDGVRFPDYVEHNGDTAKRRAVDAKRNANKRAGGSKLGRKLRPKVVQNPSESARTNLGARGEERREEEKTNTEDTTSQRQPPKVADHAAESICRPTRAADYPPDTNPLIPANHPLARPEYAAVRQESLGLADAWIEVHGMPTTQRRLDVAGLYATALHHHGAEQVPRIEAEIRRKGRYAAESIFDLLKRLGLNRERSDDDHRRTGSDRSGAPAGDPGRPQGAGGSRAGAVRDKAGRATGTKAPEGGRAENLTF